MNSWSTEEMDIAFKMKNEGFSASLIGSKIGKTRNAVLGFLHREAKKQPDKITLVVKSKLYVSKKKPPRAQPKFRKNNIEYNDFIDLLPINEISYPTKTFMHLKLFDCRAIIGAVDGIKTVYCAAPTIKGFSWCKAHRMIFITKVKHDDKKL